MTFPVTQPGGIGAQPPDDRGHLLWLGNVDMKRPRRVIIEVLARHAALQIEEP